MSNFFLKQEDIERYKKIREIPDDKVRQAATAQFRETIYNNYGVSRKKFFNIGIYPPESFGKIFVDDKRIRVEQSKKISKSDQDQSARVVEL